MSQCTEAYFLTDVENHELIIVRDDGVNRHLRFKQPGTSSFYFDLITWPGCLCITGDMGTYVFQRIEDMFEFFRTDRQHGVGEGLKINQPYWSGKLIAVCSNGKLGGSAVEFSPDKFHRRVKEQLVSWWRYGELTRKQRRELREEIEHQVLRHCDDGEARAYDTLTEFACEIDGRAFYFSDSWEWNLTDYTYHFTWCCYAIAWGVMKYDQR